MNDMEKLMRSNTLFELFIATFEILHEEAFNKMELPRIKELLDQIYSEENVCDNALIAVGKALYEAETIIRETGITIGQFVSLCNKKALN